MAGSEIVRSVLRKVERLMEENRRLRGETARLAAQKERLKAENGRLAGQLAEIRRRVDVLELREGLTSGGNTRQARARVNRLMREVDKCIALLNR